MTGGRASFNLEGAVQVPALDAAWIDMLRAAVFTLKGDVFLSEVTASIGPEVLSAEIGWVLRGDNGGLQMELTRPAKLVVQDVAPKILAALHLPTVDGATQELSAKLSSSEPVVTWSLVGDGGTASFTGDIAWEFGDAVADIPATANVEHDASWRLSAPAAVTFRVGAAAAFSGTEGTMLLREAKWVAAGTFTADGLVDLNGSLAVEASGINLADFRADAAAVNGEIHVRRVPGRWSLSTAPGLTIAMEGAAVPGRLEIADPVLLTMANLEVLGGDTATRVDISVSSNQVSGVLLGDAGQNVAFADAGGRFTLSLALKDRIEGEIQLEDVRFMLPGEAISLTAVSVRAPLGATGGVVDVALSGEMRDNGRAARFSPVMFHLKGTRDGEIVSASGTLETLNRAVRFPVESSVDLADMTGRFKIGPTGITFRKGGLQPGALSPKLAALRNVRGAVRVSAALNLDADGAVQTGLSLAFKDLSARMGDVEVSGLSGKVKFNRLSPLATAGPQQLTARHLVAGVPVDRPRVRFTVLPRLRGVSVRLHEVVGEIAGGEIAVEDARWDSTAQSNAFDVQIHDVEVDRLLRDWQVEGISGTGRLSGMIPIRIGPAGLAVAGGRLDSLGAGAIRVDWGSAREMLVNSGEQVALTVNALEDFRYDTLSIGIDQPEDGALTLAIGLEGANAAVLDGYPLRFNINLSGELAPIMDAVREGRRIGADLLQAVLARASKQPAGKLSRPSPVMRYAYV